MPSNITHVITPIICQPSKPDKDGIVTPPRFEGTITIFRPKYVERKQLRELIDGESMLGEIDDAIEEQKEYLDGAMPAAGEAAKPKKKPKVNWGAATDHIIARMQPYIQSVNIKRVSDGHVFDKYEQLEVDADMEVVLVETAMQLVTRYNLGKQS